MRLHAKLALLVMSVSGLAFGAWLHRVQPRRANVEIESLVRELALDVSRQDYGPAWKLLAPDTRAHFEKGHRGMVQFAAFYDERLKETPPPQHVVVAAAQMQRLHGMTMAELCATTPESMWAAHLAKALAGGGSEFDGLTVESVAVAVDGNRGAVSCRLPSGRAQDFHVVQTDEGWRVVDFQPYWRLPQWPTQSPGDESRLTAHRDAATADPR